MVKRSWNISLFPTRPPLLTITALPSTQTAPLSVGVGGNEGGEGDEDKNEEGRKEGTKKRGGRNR